MQVAVYLDNNATTRPHDVVIEAMRPYQEKLYFNASSIAGDLLGAAAPLDDARMALLELFGGDPDADRIILTSGATEANAWVFAGALTSPAHAVTSAVEHSSVLAAAAAARRRGHSVEVAGADQDGRVNLDGLRALLRPETRLVSIQFANNETGVVQPLVEAASMVRAIAPGALVHCDATQAVGRLPIDLSGDLGEIDLLSFSGHKFHGPKGTGGLVLRQGVTIEPLIAGEQGGGLRGGTYNVPAAAGLAIAARLALDGLDGMSAVEQLRNTLEAQLLSLSPNATIHGRHVERLPNTASIAFPGLDADHVVEQLALQGVIVAAGSACTAGATGGSHVLSAMGIHPDLVRSTLRFSLSGTTSQEEIKTVVDALASLSAARAGGACTFAD